MGGSDRQYVFGPFRLHPVEGLFRDGAPIALRPKPMLLLSYLVQHPGRVLSTSTILSNVWTDTVVDARGIKAYVSQLRKALGDDPASPRYIETLPKRGYRFKPAVEVVASATSPGVADTPAHQERAGRGEASRDRHPDRGTGPETFVGRRVELDRLHGLLRDVRDGTGRLVFIAGEAGIGKTTLAEEFLRRATADEPGILVGCGRCLEQHGTSEAYLPFLDALGSLLGGAGRARVAAVLQAYAPTWCLQLPAEFASMGTLAQLLRETVGATKDRMLRELGDALGRLTAESPVVLLLEDLHWTDASSADLLRYLAARISGQRLLLVATMRPEAIERPGHPLRGCYAELVAREACEGLVLGPLAPEDVARYLDARFVPNGFPPDLARAVHRRSGGHPLFVASLVEFMVERGDIASVAGGWTLARPLALDDAQVPESLGSIIRAQIDALDEVDRRALRYASVQGEEFLSTVLAHLTGIDEPTLEERLQRLERVHRLIDLAGEEELPDGRLTLRYRFRHALRRQVLYEDLVSARRMLLHREVGECLLRHHAGQPALITAQLARHFEQGRDFARAVDFRIRMGDGAAAMFANAEAEGHYLDALQLVERLPSAERARAELTILERRGVVNLNVSRFDQALAHFCRMRTLAADLGDAASETTALNGAASSYFFSHRLDEMARALDEAQQAAERSGDPGVRLETMKLVGLRRVGYGELREATPLLDDTIETARRIHAPSPLCGALAWRGAVHYWQSEYALADRALSEACELAAALQDGFLLLFSLFIQGLVRGNQGRMSDGLDCLTEASRIAERNGDRFWSARLPNCIGWIHRELGDFDAAIAHDRRGLDVGGTRHVVEAQANALINLCVDYTSAGRRPDETLAVLREVETMSARDEWFRWRYDIRRRAATAEHWLRTGDLARAAEQAEGLDATARDHGAWKYVAIADFLGARILVAQGDEAAACDRLERAVDVLREHAAPLVAWKVDALLGRLEQKRGRRDAAAEALARSARVVHAIAGSVRDQAMRDAFLASPAVREVLGAAP